MVESKLSMMVNKRWKPERSVENMYEMLNTELLLGLLWVIDTIEVNNHYSIDNGH